MLLVLPPKTLNHTLTYIFLGALGGEKKLILSPTEIYLLSFTT